MRVRRALPSVRCSFLPRRYLTAGSSAPLRGAAAGTFFAWAAGKLGRTYTTRFLYPAMVPMIPGDLLYYVIVSLMHLDSANLLLYGTDLAGALMGIAVGTTLASMLLHSVER